MSGMRRTFLAVIVLGLAGTLFPGAPLHAQAAPKVCKLEISGNDMMQFDKKELKAAAGCSTVQLTLKHVGKLPAQAMGHNWVLVKSADANAVASAGMAAGLPNHYVPPKDARVIAHTKVIGGGESQTIKFPTSKLKKGEAYTFMCTFPGHSALMKGKFIFG
jgi:azurin